MYAYFHSHFDKILDKHIPLKTSSNREIKQKQKPWISKKILISIKNKNNLYGLFMKTGNKSFYQQYKILRDSLNHTIRRSKIDYYKNFFDKFNKNLKKMWKGVNSFLAGKVQDTSPTCLINNNEIITNPTRIANTFNDYFCGIAKELCSKLPIINEKNYFDFLYDSSSSSFFLQPITSENVKDIIDGLDASKASDIFNFPIRAIKLVSHLINEPLSIIYNKSFTTGVFPDKLKLAKVIPLFKNGVRTLVKNYRPVSILPIFDKILEKLVNKQLVDFLEKNKILSNFQYGFQKNRSTSLAVVDVVSKITKTLENKKIPCCIFLDFAKAFDTIDHTILLKKLEHYGIRGVAKDWFQSYLNSRFQTVIIGNVTSTSKENKYGVPQGSVLGPTLFLMYINDISNCLNKSIPTIFADDNNLFFQDDDLDNLVFTINSELREVSSWLIANRLTLNVDKSNIVLFQNKSKLKLDISLNGEKLKQTAFVKYLGVLIDERLSWDKHIFMITKKIQQGIGMISKIRHGIPSKMLKPLFSSFVTSHVNYAIEAWGGTKMTNKMRIEKLIKKAVKLIYFKDKRESVENLMVNQGILNVLELIALSWYKLIHMFLQNLLPKQFKDLFIILPVYQNTRFSCKKILQLPHCRLNVFKKTIFFEGVKMWNNLPSEIQDITSRNLFKNKVKYHLLSNHIDNIC